VKRILIVLTIASIWVGVCAKVSGQQAEAKAKAEATIAGIPKWVMDYFNFRTGGTGRWVTDNSKYKGENEPFDEYVTEWTWSAGKQSIKGRLVGLKEKKEVATFVEFRMFWHPAQRKVITQAFSANGSHAAGELQRSESEIRIEHTVFNLAGGSYRELIREIDSKDEFRTEDFIWKDGNWVPQRTYLWRRV